MKRLELTLHKRDGETFWYDQVEGKFYTDTEMHNLMMSHQATLNIGHNVTHAILKFEEKEDE